MAAWSGLRVCFNSAQAPGRMQEVYPTGSCRNFRPKPADPRWPGRRGTSSCSSQIRYIPLMHGQFAIVDAEDYEWLNRYTWVLWSGYAIRHSSGKSFFMHREIVQAPPGMVVDHINGNRLDNRRCNLRLCTRPQNVRNAAKRPGCLSQYKGVSFDRRHNSWYATIWFKNRSIGLGHYHDEAQTARAYDRAALELFGEFAWLNFPEEIEARRQEIADPHYEKKSIPKPRRKKSAKQRPVHAKANPARRKSHAGTQRRRAEKRKTNRSATKAAKTMKKARRLSCHK
jgi:hypothetical protein